MVQWSIREDCVVPGVRRVMAGTGDCYRRVPLQVRRTGDTQSRTSEGHLARQASKPRCETYPPRRNTLDC